MGRFYKSKKDLYKIAQGVAKRETYQMFAGARDDALQAGLK